MAKRKYNYEYPLIQHYMIENNISLRQLAVKAGLSPAGLYKVLRGFNDPRESTMNQLRACGIKPTWWSVKL